MRLLGSYPVYLLLSAGLALSQSMAWGVNLVYQVEKVGLNPLQLVLVGTALELTCFLLEVPTGVIADVYSRRLSVIIGTFLIGAGFIVMGAVPEFWVLLVSQVICGAGYTCLSGATEAWIADEVGEGRAGKAFVRGAQLGHAGSIAGFLLAVVLGTRALQLPIIVGGAVSVVLGVVMVLVMREHGFTPAPREERSSWGAMRHTLVEGGSLVRRRPILLTILGITAVFGMYNEGFDRLWTAHLLHEFTLPAIGPLEPLYWFAIISISIEVFGLLALEVVRRRVNMNSHLAVTRMLMVINALLIGAIIAFAFAGSFALALVLLIGGQVLREAIYPIKTAWVNQSLEPGVRATVISLTGQADAVGQIAGGPAVGVVGTVVSLRAAIAVAGLVLSPGLLLYARALGQGHRPELAAEATAADG